MQCMRTKVKCSQGSQQHQKCADENDCERAVSHVSPQQLHVLVARVCISEKLHICTGQVHFSQRKIPIGTPWDRCNDAYTFQSKTLS
jgi:hypothetical protein